MSAWAPVYDALAEPTVTVCMTALQDVGRFVTEALELRPWPPELRMYWGRFAVRNWVVLVQQLRGQLFDPLELHSLETLRSALGAATLAEDATRQSQVTNLLATVEGQYDIADANLNRAFADVRPISFIHWFAAKWNNA
ncbi:hypothetical protein H2203_001618 [Taxawa tesnikishii (nom. ined.)]|nr:hypothetical protein H2203_001618 [Dothideales sp. JES 119]